MRRWTAAGALTVLVSTGLGVPASEVGGAEPPPLTAVVLADTADPADREAAEALRDELAAATSRGVTVTLSSVGAETDAVRFAVAEAMLTRPDVVVAVGTRIADGVAGAARGVPVLRVAARARAFDAAGGAGVSGAWRADGGLAEELRRLTPGTRRLGWVGAAPESTAAPGHELTALVPVGDDAAARAADVVARLLPHADVLWAGDDVPAGDVAALASELAGRGVPLLGSLREHLDAGALAVVRCSPRDVGALGAAAALRLAATADAGALRVAAAPRRRLREIHLAHARRLGFQLPVTSLAAADHVVPAPPVRR